MFSDDDECGVGIGGRAPGFHPDDTGSTPVLRSKDRKQAKRSLCVICNTEHLSVKRRGVWTSTCSRKCAVSLANSRRPKKSQQLPKPKSVQIRGLCRCGSPLRGFRTVRCWSCYQQDQEDEIAKRMATLTLGDVVAQSHGYKNRHAYQKVRNHAHYVIRKAGLTKVCFVCFYPHGVEVCHIKAISMFDRATPIADINALSNLRCLCPNHHWEQEHGLLIL